MDKIEKHTLVVGPFQCNCSILVCKKTKEGIVIDPGDEFSKIRSMADKAGVNLKYAVHTHAHLDHIGAIGDLKKWSPETKISLHRDDEALYKNLPMQGQMFGINYEIPPPVDYFLKDEEEIQVGDFKFKILHTPGHSPGGVCVHFKEGELSTEPTLFSGDTLFQSSIGRTDLWGADSRTLIKSIKNRILVLDEETIVHPGHGNSTQVGIEAQENPFL